MSSNEAENVPTMNVNQESATMRKDTAGMDLYAILDISKNAGSKEVRDWGTLCPLVCACLFSCVSVWNDGGIQTHCT